MSRILSTSTYLAPLERTEPPSLDQLTFTRLDRTGAYDHSGHERNEGGEHHEDRGGGGVEGIPEQVPRAGERRRGDSDHRARETGGQAGSGDSRDLILSPAPSRPGACGSGAPGHRSTAG